MIDKIACHPFKTFQGLPSQDIVCQKIKGNQPIQKEGLTGARQQVLGEMALCAGNTVCISKSTLLKYIELELFNNKKLKLLEKQLQLAQDEIVGGFAEGIKSENILLSLQDNQKSLECTRTSINIEDQKSYLSDMMNFKLQMSKVKERVLQLQIGMLQKDLFETY